MNRPPDEQLTDAALDREIERALAIDPSPEFAAQVRARIARDHAQPAWTLSWTIAVGATMALAALTFGRVWTPQAPLSEPMVSVSPPDPSMRVDVPVLRGRPLTAITQSLGAKTVPASKAPVVLVESREAETIRRMMRGRGAGDLVVSDIDRRPGILAAFPTIQDIAVPTLAELQPLAIEPLIPRADQGVR